MRSVSVDSHSFPAKPMRQRARNILFDVPIGEISQKNTPDDRATGNEIVRQGMKESFSFYQSTDTEHDEDMRQIDRI